MTEKQFDDHGDATLNASMVCLQNPFAAGLAVQQQLLQQTIAVQQAWFGAMVNLRPLFRGW